MIQKLKTKIVITIMLILSSVLIGILGAVNISQRVSGARQNSRFLNMLSAKDPALETTPGMPLKGMNQKEDKVMEHSNFCVVLLDGQGNIISTEGNYRYLYADDEIKEIVEGILDTDKQEGTYEDNRFLITDTPGGQKLVIVDTSLSVHNMNRLLLFSIMIAVFSLGIFFVISMFLAKWLVCPIGEAFDRQRQFISDASHELKTPLSVIAANAAVLQDEIGNNKWLSYIRMETTRMNGLVGDLLYLAKLDENESRFPGADFDLGKAVTSVVLPFESRAFEEGKRLYSHIEEGIVIHGEEENIKKVVSILTDNALKHSSAGGTINVTLKRQAHRECVLEVTNSGNGIIKEELTKIFERFYCSDSSRNKEKSGYGLGLSIAKSIVERHRGRIWAESDGEEWVKFFTVFTEHK